MADKIKETSNAWGFAFIAFFIIVLLVSAVVVAFYMINSSKALDRASEQMTEEITSNSLYKQLCEGYCSAYFPANASYEDGVCTCIDENGAVVDKTDELI